MEEEKEEMKGTKENEEMKGTKENEMKGTKENDEMKGTKEKEEMKGTKEKRRSSFVRGRLSMKLEPSTSDICLNIPLDLCAEERFLKLLQLCYMKAVENVSKDLFPDDGKEAHRFLMDANEEFQKTVPLVKERKLLQLTKDSDSDMLKTNKSKEIEIYEEYMNRLSEESNAWDRIMEEAKIKLSHVQNSANEQQPIILKPEENTSSRYDEMIGTINQMKKELNVELQTLPKMNKLLEAVSEKAEENIIYQNNILASVMFEEVKDSPHRLIKNAIEKK